MTYSKDEMFELLLNSGVVVAIDGGFCVNQVFAKKLNATRSDKYCKNYPDRFKGLGDAIIYKKVMEACEVPIMRKGDISYVVRTQTNAAVRVLKKILSNPSIDYNLFISQSKAFYGSNIAFPGFAKYLAENLWEAIYADKKQISEAKRDTRGVI